MNLDQKTRNVITRREEALLDPVDMYHLSRRQCGHAYWEVKEQSAFDLAEIEAVKEK